jgi:glutathione synthase/RimK-type ligase-like ATP-grasp enzyme
MILLAGGQQDHNMRRVLDAVQARDFAHKILWTDRPQDLSFTFNANATDLSLSQLADSKLRHSLFIRHDVFYDQNNCEQLSEFDLHTRSHISSAWYTAVKGWAMAAPNIRILNEGSPLGHEPNKLRNLPWAKEPGFDLPETIVTNDPTPFLKNSDQWIIKPVDGGAYTKVLSDYIEEQNSDLSLLRAMPWFYQEKLSYPEIRVFQAGEWQFAFNIHNDDIDSRIRNDSMNVSEASMPNELSAPMRALSGRLGLDYSAADFKTCPKTGRLKFLEINTMPMITGYDTAAGGQLSDALALTLNKLQM